MRPYLTLHHPATARLYYERDLWQADTFYDLVARHAQHNPDGAALRDGQTQLNWGQTLARVDALAGDLSAKGLSAGERVSVWMSNRVEAVIAALACSRLGLACNPSLHRSYTCAEIVTLLTRLQSAAIVTESGWGADRLAHDFDAMLAELPFIKAVYPADELAHLWSLPESAPATLQAGAEAVSDPDAVVYLAFTSGTTGEPKCVMHSSNTLLANGRDMAKDWSLTSQTRLLTLSPLSHHIAWVAVAQWLACGCELITDDPPKELSRLDWITQTGATYVMGVPTHAIDVLAERDRRGLTGIGDVKVFYMAGAAIPPVVAEAFAKAGIKPQNVYGMTENSSHQYTHADDDLSTGTTTCGRGGPAYEVRIFDPENEDRELPVGEVGQIGGRGAALMLGYFDNQSATAASFNRAGWFLSGDLGSLDAAGNLRIDGRLKDLIIRGGHNIYPTRIEALAHRHDKIEKAAVFPVADDRLGEKVCLAIIGSLTAEQALAHLAAEGLSKYDMPEYFLCVQEFPLTASGKILKRALVDMVRNQELTPEPVRYVAS